MNQETKTEERTESAAANHYQLVSAILRRSKVSAETLSEVESRVSAIGPRGGISLEEIVFSPELLDLAPDIFPPHLVSAFIERNESQGVRERDTWESYLRRHTKGKDQTTLRLLSRQIRSAAKADATRRTTAVHPMVFNDVQEIMFDSLDEKYFIFPEEHAKEKTGELILAGAAEVFLELVTNYRTATGTAVPEAFFTLMDFFTEHGLAVQRDAKHKYPIHGLLYGSNATFPANIRERMQQSGQLLLESLLQYLPEREDALSFSIDFFLDNLGNIWIGRDIHEQQIGMGLAHQLLGPKTASSFYNALIETIRKRTAEDTISINCDEALCRKNTLYKMELEALKTELEKAGYEVILNGKAPFILRLFGGTKGIPTQKVTALTDDKLLIDNLLEEHRGTFAEIGVKVPRTYRCTAQELIDSPNKTAEALETNRVFVHPTIHHGFKPFEISLSSRLTEKVIKETFCKAGGPQLNQIKTVAMERIPNTIEYNGRNFPHEVRAYFLPRW